MYKVVMALAHIYLNNQLTNKLHSVCFAVMTELENEKRSLDKLKALAL